MPDKNKTQGGHTLTYKIMKRSYLICFVMQSEI